MSESEYAAAQPLHDFLGAAHDENAKRTLWVVALTSVMMVAEIAAGYWTGSMALLADGFHMAPHAGALGLAALASRYGTGKVGDLTRFASALILGIFSIGIAVESVLRLIDPVRVDFTSAALVAVLGLAVNIVSAFMLMGGHRHGHDHDHGRDHDHDQGSAGHHHQGHDNNLRSAYFHVLADALTSVLAIAALLAGRYLGLGWMDPAMGIAGALVIARWSWSLMRDTAAILLDETDAELAEALRERIGAISDLRLIDLHVWRVGPQARAAIVEVEGNSAPSQLRSCLADLHLAHLTIAVR